MLRLAILLHVIIAPPLTGAFVLVAMIVPWIQNDLGRWIVIAAIAGFVVSIPLSLITAKTHQGKLA